MKKILSIFFGFLLITLSAQAEEKLTVEKQLIGVLGVASGTISNGTKELKTGDKVYLGETILSGTNSGAQLLLLDQSTFTIGSDSEVVMDTFIYDPKNNDGKIVSTVKKGSLKVISGLISKKNPDNLIVEVPEGTLGSRGTEFQTIVNKRANETRTLLIGPGKNNSLGLRPGAVLVSNQYGNTMLNKPYSFTKMKKGSAPEKARKVTKRQLKLFKKQVKALRVAKLQGSSKEERKKLRKEIKDELKKLGVSKDERTKLIKLEIQNLSLQIEKPLITILPDADSQEFELELEGEAPNITLEAPTTLEPVAAKQDAVKDAVKDKKKEAVKKNKKKKKKKAVKKKKKKKKKKAVKKNKKKKKKKAVKKNKKKKKKKVVKKKTKKKKKKVVKKKKKKKKKKVVKKKKKKKKIVKKKVAKKKKKAKKKRQRKK